MTHDPLAFAWINPRLRGGLLKSWRIGDKTGQSGRDMTGDIAVDWPTPDTPIVIAVYTLGRKPTEKQFDRAFAGIGRVVALSLACGRLETFGVTE